MDLPNLRPNQIDLLQGNLLEYLFNQNYTFQATPMFEALKKASESWDDEQRTKILKRAFNKYSMTVKDSIAKNLSAKEDTVLKE